MNALPIPVDAIPVPHPKIGHPSEANLSLMSLNSLNTTSNNTGHIHNTPQCERTGLNTSKEIMPPPMSRPSSRAVDNNNVNIEKINETMEYSITRFNKEMLGFLGSEEKEDIILTLQIENSKMNDKVKQLKTWVDNEMGGFADTTLTVMQEKEDEVEHYKKEAEVLAGELKECLRKLEMSHEREMGFRGITGGGEGEEGGRDLPKLPAEIEEGGGSYMANFKTGRKFSIRDSAMLKDFK